MTITKDDLNLFIGCLNGYLYKFSINDNQIIKQYGKIASNNIESMVITPDNKYLFISDMNGDVRMMDVSYNSDKIIKKYSKLHSTISSITISQDGEFVFTSGFNDYK